jgi:hypothetical protein
VSTVDELRLALAEARLALAVAEAELRILRASLAPAAPSQPGPRWTGVAH